MRKYAHKIELAGITTRFTLLEIKLYVSLSLKSKY